MDNERTVKYNITSGVPLTMDHNYAHCNTIVLFDGFEAQGEDTTFYFLLGAPLQYMIPLTDDMTVLITREYTKKAGKIKGQLLECKLAENSTDTYEFMRYSNVFDVIITPSLAAASMVEVTDPRLELIYTQMHEKYLEVVAHEYTAEQSAAAAATSATNASASATSAASEAATAYSEARSASVSAREAEGYAVGEQNGQEVIPGSYYYENNAKYYAEQAGTSASTATAKASESASSALVSEGWAVGKQNGVDVPSSSDYYHNNAKWHADMAERNAVPFNVRNAILALFESAAYAETGLTDEIAIVESWANEVTSLAVSPTTLSLTGATPQAITATVVPQTAPVTWSSSNTTIATVVGGVVTGVSNGSCTITAIAGGISKTCAVTVSGFATLESISAVYTQSGTVYETDSLDSLKADLVVTATYSDSSTATVPSTDYTLSGTLVVGTSTITVTYRGKTTTFTVTVSEESLPTGYTKYDYLYSNATANNVGCYINIELTFSSASLVKVTSDAQMDSSETWLGVVVGCRQTGTSASANNLGYYLGYDIPAGGITSWSNSGSNTIDTTVDMTAKHHIVSTWSPTGLSTKVDNNATITKEYNTRAIGGLPMCLFGVKHATAAAGGTPDTFRGKIYYTEIEVDNVVVAKLYPCVRDSDSTVGVYDMVRQEFYTYYSLASGKTITAGNDA